MSEKITISNSYLDLCKALHVSLPNFGTTGERRAKAVILLKNSFKAQSVLDYGCGKGTLAKKLPFPIFEFDPAIPGKDNPPNPADLVICSDVLEHVELEFLDNVLADLRRVTLLWLLAIINTGPANKKLPDGRNAHLIQKPSGWWIERISSLFVVTPVACGQSNEVHLHCRPL